MIKYLLFLEICRGDDFYNEAGYRQSRDNDKIDSTYGFDRVKDSVERTGYLINMHSVCKHQFIYVTLHIIVINKN